MKISTPFIFLFFVTFLLPFNIYSQTVSMEDLVSGSQIYKQLNTKIPLDLDFTNQNNQKIKLKDYFKETQVLILTLNFFRCTGLCPMQFRNLIDTLNQIPEEILKKNNFHIVSISFDPTDSAEKANLMTQAWKPLVKNKSIQWDFIVGSGQNTEKLAHSMNFYYTLEDGFYNHSAALFFIDPHGTFKKYLFGSVYEPSDFIHALYDTTLNHKIDLTFKEKLEFLMTRFNNIRGKYISLF